MRSLLQTWRRSWLPAVILSCGLALLPPGAALAQEAKPLQPGEDSPSEMAREGIEKLMRALSALVESIPQYELPEVLDNGDIIIRRKNPEGDSSEPEFDETTT